jgi:aspartate racemase
MPESATPHPVVGIIGGMGPEATVQLMARLIARTPASDDADHVHVIVESNPKIPSRIAHLVEGTGEDPTPELLRIARNLEQAGATFLAMPCNTAHGYAPAIAAAVGIPLLNMVELTTKRVQTLAPGGRAGLLASTAVHRTGLYRQAFAPHGLQVVLPEDQAAVMELIQRVKRGDTGPAATAELARLASSFEGAVDCVLIACTELSLLTSALPEQPPWVDALEVLTEAILAQATL